MPRLQLWGVDVWMWDEAGGSRGFGEDRQKEEDLLTTRAPLCRAG